MVPASSAAIAEPHQGAVRNFPSRREGIKGRGYEMPIDTERIRRLVQNGFDKE